MPEVAPPAQHAGEVHDRDGDWDAGEAEEDDEEDLVGPDLVFRVCFRLRLGLRVGGGGGLPHGGGLGG